MNSRLVRIAVIVAGVSVILAAAVLCFDHFQASLTARQNDARLEAIQKKVRQDSAQAAVLYAEQQRLVRARDSRNARVKYLSWFLIFASAAFVSGAKWLVERQPKRRSTYAAMGPAATHSAVKPALPLANRGRNAAVKVPTIDLSFVDELIAREGTAAESAISILQAIQNHYRYLPDEALLRVCELTEITPSQIAGTSSFYSRFRRGPVGQHIVRVCHGTACHVSGASQITEQLRRDLHIPDGSDTDPERMFTLEEVACLGCCSLAPVLMVDEHTAGKLTPSTARNALDAVRPRETA